MHTQHHTAIERAATSEHTIRRHKPNYSRTFGINYLFCWARPDTIVILFVDRVARRLLWHAHKIMVSMKIDDVFGSRGWRSKFLPATPSVFNTPVVHSTLMNTAIPVTWRKLMRICSMKSKKMEFTKLHHDNGYPMTLFTFLMQEIPHEHLKATTSCQAVEIVLLFLEYSVHNCIYAQLSKCLFFQFWFTKVQCNCSHSRCNVDQNTLGLAWWDSCKWYIEYVLTTEKRILWRPPAKDILPFRP